MQEIKKNIIQKKGIIYLDYAASGQGYKPIEKKMQKILLTYANTHSEFSSNAIKTKQYYDDARARIKKALEINDDFYIMPCGTGATAAIKKFQEIIGTYLPPQTISKYKIKIKNKPLVVVGPYEHHSNEVSFRESLCDIQRIGLNNNRIDYNELEEVLEKNKHREIIASFNIASNVTGIISDYKKIYKLVKKYNGIVAFDAAASSAHMNLDCNYYDAMFLSPHKLLGGPGSCGILVIKKDLYKSHKPTFAGGGTVSYVSRSSHYFLNDIELIEDGGTPGILQFIKASFAYELRNEIGIEKIKETEDDLKYYFGSRVKKIENLTLYCSHQQEKIPIFSLNLKYMEADDLALALSKKYKIQTRSGCNCAGPYGHDLLELTDDQEFTRKPGWLRISMHFTTTKEEIDILLNALSFFAKQN